MSATPIPPETKKEPLAHYEISTHSFLKNAKKLSHSQASVNKNRLCPVPLLDALFSTRRDDMSISTEKVDEKSEEAATIEEEDIAHNEFAKLLGGAPDYSNNDKVKEQHFNFSRLLLSRVESTVQDMGKHSVVQSKVLQALINEVIECASTIDQAEGPSSHSVLDTTCRVLSVILKLAPSEVEPRADHSNGYSSRLSAPRCWLTKDLVKIVESNRDITRSMIWSNEPDPILSATMSSNNTTAVHHAIRDCIGFRTAAEREDEEEIAKVMKLTPATDTPSYADSFATPNKTNSSRNKKEKSWGWYWDHNVEAEDGQAEVGDFTPGYDDELTSPSLHQQEHKAESSGQQGSMPIFHRYFQSQFHASTCHALHLAMFRASLGMCDPNQFVQVDMKRKYAFLNPNFTCSFSDQSSTNTVDPVLTEALHHPALRLIYQHCRTGTILLRLDHVVETARQKEILNGLGSYGNAAIHGVRGLVGKYKKKVLTLFEKSAFQISSNKEGNRFDAVLKAHEKLLLLETDIEVLADLFSISFSFGDEGDGLNANEILQHCCTVELLSRFYERASATFLHQRPQRSQTATMSPGESMASRVAYQLLIVVLRPLVRMVSSWVQHGVLDDPYDEFFILPSYGATNCGYQIEESRLPCFMSHEVASSILHAGISRLALTATVGQSQTFREARNAKTKLLVKAAQPELMLHDEDNEALEQLSNVSDGFFNRDECTLNFIQFLETSSPEIQPTGSTANLAAWHHFFLQADDVYNAWKVEDGDMGDFLELVVDAHIKESDGGVSEGWGKETGTVTPSNISLIAPSQSVASFATDSRRRAEELYKMQKEQQAKKMQEYKQEAEKQIQKEHDDQMKALQYQHERRQWKMKRERLNLYRKKCFENEIEDVTKWWAWWQQHKKKRQKEKQDVDNLHQRMNEVYERYQLTERKGGEEEEDSELVLTPERRAPKQHEEQGSPQPERDEDKGLLPLDPSLETQRGAMVSHAPKDSSPQGSPIKSAARREDDKVPASQGLRQPSTNEEDCTVIVQRTKKECGRKRPCPYHDKNTAQAVQGKATKPGSKPSSSEVTPTQTNLEPMTEDMESKKLPEGDSTTVAPLTTAERGPLEQQEKKDAVPTWIDGTRLAESVGATTTTSVGAKDLTDDNEDALFKIYTPDQIADYIEQERELRKKRYKHVMMGVRTNRMTAASMKRAKRKQPLEQIFWHSAEAAAKHEEEEVQQEFHQIMWTEALQYYETLSVSSGAQKLTTSGKDHFAVLLSGNAENEEADEFRQLLDDQLGDDETLLWLDQTQEPSVESDSIEEEDEGAKKVKTITNRDHQQAVNVEAYFESWSFMTCRFLTQRCLDVLVRHDQGPIRCILDVLIGILLLQDGLSADTLMTDWKDAVIQAQQNAPSSSSTTLAGSSNRPFDAMIAYAAMLRSFNKVVNSYVGNSYLQLRLAAPTLFGGATENEEMSSASDSEPSAGRKKGVVGQSMPGSRFELLPHLSIEIMYCIPEFWIFPVETVKRYGDLFISLVFWRWVADLTTSIWQLSMRSSGNLVPEVWTFVILTRNVFQCLIDHVWSGLSAACNRYRVSMFPPRPVLPSATGSNTQSPVKGGAATTVFAPSVIAPTTTRSTSAFTTTLISWSHRMDRQQKFTATPSDLGARQSARAPNSSVWANLSSPPSANEAASSSILDRYNSLDEFTFEHDEFLCQCFVSGLLSPEYNKARKILRSMVRLLEEVEDYLTKRCVSPSSTRSVHKSNVSASRSEGLERTLKVTREFMRKRFSDFCTTTEIFIKQIIAADSMVTTSEITSLINALNAVLRSTTLQC